MIIHRNDQLPAAGGTDNLVQLKRYEIWGNYGHLKFSSSKMIFGLGKIVTHLK